MEPQNPQNPQSPQIPQVPQQPQVPITPTTTATALTPEPASVAGIAQSPFARRRGVSRRPNNSTVTNESMTQEIMAVAQTQPVLEKKPVKKRILAVAIAMTAIIIVASAVALAVRNKNNISNEDAIKIISDSMDSVSHIETILQRIYNHDITLSSLLNANNGGALSAEIENVKKLNELFSGNNNIKKEARDRYNDIKEVLSNRITTYDEFIIAHNLYYDAVINENISVLDNNTYATPDAAAKIKNDLFAYLDSKEKIANAKCNSDGTAACKQLIDLNAETRARLYGDKTSTADMFSSIVDIYNFKNSMTIYTAMQEIISLMES